MKISKIILILFSILIVSACTWVNVKPGAETVRVAKPEQVLNCKKMGSSTVTVTAEVAAIARDPETIQQELVTLARNSAADLGGNVVVPVSKIDKGKQIFVIYDCP
ncbi:hypothetical protein MNBD_GAMMA24-680 [hydrothermal vent metagenome]|uniref:DUF4156 domain-containing protein n=1 Tax=hydrothermal vent metagenome TaxID=652676 RepID=A0A3B1BQD3_9ZZZZ